MSTSLLLALIVALGSSQIPEDPRSLRQAAKDSGVYIGSAINYFDLQSDNEYSQLAAE